MGDKKLYIVAKVFDQPGCLAYRCKRRMRPDACRARWRLSGRREFKS